MCTYTPSVSRAQIRTQISNHAYMHNSHAHAHAHANFITPTRNPGRYDTTVTVTTVSGLRLQAQFRDGLVRHSFWKFIASVRKAMTRKSWKAGAENYSTGMQSMLLDMSRKTRKTHIQKPHTIEVSSKAYGTKAGQEFQVPDLPIYVHFTPCDHIVWLREGPTRNRRRISQLTQTMTFFWKFIKSVRKAMTRKSWKAGAENYSTGMQSMLLDMSRKTRKTRDIVTMASLPLPLSAAVVDWSCVCAQACFEKFYS